MPRRADSINISIQLTPEEHEALNKHARRLRRSKTVIIRAALAASIPNYPEGEWDKQADKD